MKKSIGLLFVLCFLLQINNFLYGQDEDRWVYVGDIDKGSFYLDSNSISYDKSNEIISCWIKCFCTKDCDVYLSGKKVATRTFEISKFNFDRENKMFQLEQSIIYLQDGSYSKFEDNTYNYIVPDTSGEYLYNYIIKHYFYK